MILTVYGNIGVQIYFFERWKCKQMVNPYIIYKLRPAFKGSERKNVKY